MSITTTDKNITTQVASSIEQRLKADATPQRLQALQTLNTLQLPTTKNEEYKHTPLTRLLEKNFTFANEISESTLRAEDLNSLLIDGLEADRIVFVNGKFNESLSSAKSSTSLKIVPLKEAIVSSDLARQHFGAYANFKEDAFTAWNTAEWLDGFFIHVDDNVVIDKPVIFYHINDTQAGEVRSSIRNLIVVGKNSEVTFIEKFDSIGSGNHLSTLVTEGVVHENAGLNYYTIQNDKGNRYQYGLMEFYQKNSSRVNTYTFTLDGKAVRNNLHLKLDGEGIESHMYGLYLLGGDTLADNHTVVDHKKPNSFSNELYKGIMDGNSKGVFNGKIYVRPDAQKTNAFQANRNVLLTDKATVNTKPQLEIWADDVKCSHGCTSGQIDEEAIFYLQARGISKETARAMMLYAFAGEVLDNIKHPALHAYIDKLVSERLHKNF
ncbi:Fe-S cluster assembly protein SufD [Chryseosolibacter indicus]|uniref:Fe-S cluster assembly protein SufD n=1 Tax=Chryseosolibacter indicus TaxID=2782351 RepID=A0ABS5VQL9_9BACT|nr:Fe-S cluster assembly protein SufD [Chryseosolibacter indicus]MBT1703298.1 Fe-S cluster assembly protein SufD [Chryseosolibacter indicus]